MTEHVIALYGAELEKANAKIDQLVRVHRYGEGKLMGEVCDILGCPRDAEALLAAARRVRKELTELNNRKEKK